MIENLINTIKTSNNDTILFGASSVLSQLYNKITDLGIKITDICDNDKNKQGKEVFGHIIKTPNIIFKKKKNYNVIITSSFFKEIELQLKEFNNIKICINYIELRNIINTTNYTPNIILLKTNNALRTDYNNFVRNIQQNTNPIVISRFNFSKNYLQGKGLEIGAFHLPTPINTKNVKEIDYLDQISMTEIKTRFPEFNNTYCVYPNIIDNGEKLYKIEKETYDFIIANHMLEHCENFFKTITNHLKVLKKGGLLFYSIPDKKHTFDKYRRLTTYEHLKNEFLYGTNEHMLYEHYYDFCKNVSKLKNSELTKQVERYMSERMDTHFHVWSKNSLLKHLNYAINEGILNAELLDFKQELDIEIMFILKKND